MTKLTSGSGFSEKAESVLTARPATKSGIMAGGIMRFQCFRPVCNDNLFLAMALCKIEVFLAKFSNRLSAWARKNLNDSFPVERELIWTEDEHNIVPDTALTDILETYFNGSAYTATHFVALKDTGVPVAADTMAAHASWATISPYSNGTDPAYNPAAAAAESIDNSASKAVFNINITDSVVGAFLKDNSTVDGATGLLIAVVDFASPRSVESGDTLEVTYTVTAADDGV